jgi:hypothetical protein
LTEQGRITWDQNARAQFLQILEQIPALIRGIAETRINKKVENILRQDNRFLVTEKDMVQAFFEETPPGFIPAMKDGMDSLGIDYAKYGYPK